MEASILRSNENRSVLILQDFKLSLLNAMRRSILNSVKTLAIEDVTIYKNYSSMYDEVLAARLGLIPIKTPMPMSGHKEFTFKLKEIGPKAVHASDLVPSDSDVKPVLGDMLIMNLKSGESIDLEAKAVLGNGAEHAKFVPAHVFYHFYPVIDIKTPKVKGASKIASVCPVDILSGEGDTLSVKKGKLQDCILCKACQDYAGEDVIRIGSDSNKVVFDVESWGQLGIKDMLSEAVSSLEDELKQISDKI